MSEIRTNFNGVLAQIGDELFQMAAMVIEGLRDVTGALLAGDVEAADRVVDGDDELDLLSLEIDELCLTTFATQQPVAIDLRRLISAMRMNSEIERSGDLIANIGKAVGRLQGAHISPRIRTLILNMSEQATLLFRQAMAAFEADDAEAAGRLGELDDRLDQLHSRYIEVVINSVSHGELVAQQGLQLAVLGRFYERIGDHAVNIGERVVYMVSGWQPEAAGAERARRRREVDELGRLREPAIRRSIAVIEEVHESRRIDDIRRDFVANVSHELKTPVGAISLLAETLYDEPDETVRKRLLDRMLNEANRADRIIEDLLQLSRLEERNEPTWGKVRIADVVTEAVDQIHTLAEQRSIEIRVINLNRDLHLSVDGSMLVQALVNLLDNALKYSEQGTVVDIEIDEFPDEVGLIVRDGGIGIPGPDLERVFERFYRVDRARSRETGGTGLGLAIVRHVMIRHGGRVHVQSEEGKGTTFTLHIPKHRTSE